MPSWRRCGPCWWPVRWTTIASPSSCVSWSPPWSSRPKTCAHRWSGRPASHWGKDQSEALSHVTCRSDQMHGPIRGTLTRHMQEWLDARTNQRHFHTSHAGVMRETHLFLLHLHSVSMCHTDITYTYSYTYTHTHTYTYTYICIYIHFAVLWSPGWNTQQWWVEACLHI